MGLWVVFAVYGNLAFAYEPDWSPDISLPTQGRLNPYQMNELEYAQTVHAGKLHTVWYPVQATGILVPYHPLKNMIEKETRDPFRLALQKLFTAFTKTKSLNEILDWVGLPEYPKEGEKGIYSVPYPQGQRPDYPMGFTLMHRDGAVGFTISCAECHASPLFGKTVWGLTNRFPRANETFRRAKVASEYLHLGWFQYFNQATDAETQMMARTKNNLQSVGVKKPLALGLDTSLAQVALSLNRRNPDAYATRSHHYAKRPRPDSLDYFPADSKPAVWWNVKYKTRFLSDGSVTGGNPIFTNILWNELGRGADLHELSNWLDNNEQIIKELTTAVISSEAPRYLDFFSESSIRLDMAKSGQELFNQACAKCHGHYDKVWNLVQDEDAPKKSVRELIETWQVRYPSPTEVKDVGTDPLRWMGMKSLEPLNNLEISKRSGTVVQPQKGYVPPPLVGIWARWPYFHNNSAPNLCAVLSVGSKRPKAYYAGPAVNPALDFDANCNGYPVGSKVPAQWRTEEFKYDSRKLGMSNQGHDKKILILENGKERFSSYQKMQIIEFLKTL